MQQTKQKSTNVKRKKSVAKKTQNSNKLNAGIQLGSVILANQIHKSDKSTKFIALIMVIIGLITGMASCFILTKNDCFELLGGQDITIELEKSENETGLYGTFIDNGVKIISFGQDVSNDYEVEIDPKLIDNQDGSYSATQIGTYYIKYHSNSLKYGTILVIEKVRLITFVEPAEQSEKEAM